MRKLSSYKMSTPSRHGQKRNFTWHITMTMLTVQNKQWLIKDVRTKYQISYKIRPIKITMDLMKTVRASVPKQMSYKLWDTIDIAIKYCTPQKILSVTISKKIIPFWRQIKAIAVHHFSSEKCTRRKTSIFGS